MDVDLYMFCQYTWKMKKDTFCNRHTLELYYQIQLRNGLSKKGCLLIQIVLYRLVD